MLDEFWTHYSNVAVPAVDLELELVEFANNVAHLSVSAASHTCELGRHVDE